MNVPFFIAKRYLKSKKKNVVHWITRVSVVGISVITASLIILLAAFNGIESMVEKMFTDFDSSITIRSLKRKTFDYNTLDIRKLDKLDYIQLTSKAIEEIVVLRNEKKWIKRETSS